MYRIAVVQLAPELNKVDDNLIRIQSMCQNLQADLIVLPELITSGYTFSSKAELAKVSEPFHGGKSHNFFQRLSAQLDASIVYGFPEIDCDKVFNSCAMVNPDSTVGLYRKSHLFLNEKNLFSPGDTGMVTCNAKDGVRIGMMICFDWQFPEAARVLALNGAQIICHPANLVLPWCQQAMLTRSLENRIFTVTANRIGSESNHDISMTFTGQSQITNTMGEVLVRLSSGGEEIGYAEITPEQAWDKSITEKNDAFGDRRPALYTDILKPK